MSHPTNGAKAPRVLNHRPVRVNDLDLCCTLREECGWGVNRVRTNWGNADRPLCIFTMTVNGEEEVVGMGGWILELEHDPEAASRSAGTVNLCEYRNAIKFRPDR